eukprot:gene5341-5370_t
MTWLDDRTEAEPLLLDWPNPNGGTAQYSCFADKDYITFLLKYVRGMFPGVRNYPCEATCGELSWQLVLAEVLLGATVFAMMTKASQWYFTGRPWFDAIAPVDQLWWHNKVTSCRTVHQCPLGELSRLLPMFN